MHTLQIEHGISDFTTWSAAFDRMAPAREGAGVRSQRVMRLVDDPNHLVIELDFDDAASAAGFLSFLHERVWSTPENSPALVGAPRGRVLAIAA